MKIRRFTILAVCLFILIPSLSYFLEAQNRYPGKSWEVVEKPEDLGYSSEKLAVAQKYADSIDTAAVMIVVWPAYHIDKK